VKMRGSNPLQQALAQSQQAKLHPDSDLLTAFAEDALLPNERVNVLEHLAVCAQCREALQISFGATSVAAGEVRKLRPQHLQLRSWFPWVAVAAGLLVVGSAVLLHQQSRQVSQPSSQIARNEMQTAPAQTAQQSKTLPQPKASHPKHTTPWIDAVTVIPENAANPTAIAPEKEAAIRSPEQVRDTNATVAVQTENATIETQPVNLQALIKNQSAAGGGIGSGSGAGLGQGASGRLSLGPLAAAPRMAMRPAQSNWRINSQGQVEHALGDGTWQSVLTSEKSKMRVVSLIGQNLWVGGENSRLYHSTDNGTTWVAVMLPDKDGRWHVLTQISFQTQQAGKVIAEDGVFWTTEDSGRTWK